MPARPVYAADNNTEFGIADDLSIFGIEGNMMDPDFEIKGFTLFGSTSTQVVNIPQAPGNIFVSGYVQVSSGIYIAGTSTFTGRINFPAPASMYVPGGNDGQVLASDGGGSGPLKWTDVSALGDNLGNHSASKALKMNDFAIDNVSSMTINTGLITSTLTVGTWASFTGPVDVNGALAVLNANNFTVGTGLTSLGGALNVTGNSTLAGTLNVNNAAYFGAAATKSTFTTTGDLVMFGGADITMTGDSKVIIPAAPVNPNDAVNKAYVDGLNGTSGIWIRDDSKNAVKLSTMNSNVGIGVADPQARLHVSSANAAATDQLFLVSSGTLASQNIFGVEANGEVGLKGSIGIGATYAGISAPANGMTVEGAVGIGVSAPDANTKMQVKGGVASGDYITKFYSGASLAAWIKNK